MMRRVLVGALAVGLTVAGYAAPAGAHAGAGRGQADASNFESVVRDVSPQVEGLSIRVVDAGDRVELTNRTTDPVIVLGYQGEPYLRLDEDGVFQNRRSPATYLNADRLAQTEVPSDADPEAEPEWQQISNERTARWHDHRAHWMSEAPPPVAAAAPDERHVIFPRWTIPLEVGPTEVEVAGTLTWLPGPSPWPWYGAVIVGATAVAAAGLWRRWRTVLLLAVIGLTAAAVVDSIGLWWATSEPAGMKMAALSLTAVIAVGAVAVPYMAWRNPRDALVLAAGLGLAATVLFGLPRLDWLDKSQLPTGMHADIARAAVSATIAAGIGMFGLSMVRLRLLARTTGSTAEVVPALRAQQPIIPDVARHRAVVVGIVVACLALALLLS